MWRYLADSVVGTSHERSGLPCQDSNQITNVTINDIDYLILACSDGAGSAAYSDIGAKAACQEITEQVRAFLASNRSLADVDRAVLVGWFEAVRNRIAADAGARGVECRQLACTLILAVVGDENSVYGQIGDGAIVAQTSEESATTAQPVFWTQNGEYANTTYFVTDSHLDELCLFEQRDTMPDALAVFSDGIQALALDYATRTAFEPFFAPLFRSLSDIEQPSDLCVPFREFLNSKSVNDRTDDDKTLIVAVRNPDCAS